MTPRVAADSIFGIAGPLIASFGREQKYGNQNKGLCNKLCFGGGFEMIVNPVEKQRMQE